LLCADAAGINAARHNPTNQKTARRFIYMSPPFVR
jgi:hypothetical protein